MHIHHSTVKLTEPPVTVAIFNSFCVYVTVLVFIPILTVVERPKVLLFLDAFVYFLLLQKRPWRRLCNKANVSKFETAFDFIRFPLVQMPKGREWNECIDDAPELQLMCSLVIWCQSSDGCTSCEIITQFRLFLQFLFVLFFLCFASIKKRKYKQTGWHRKAIGQSGEPANAQTVLRKWGQI